MREITNAFIVLVTEPEGRGNLQDLKVDGIVILKRIFKDIAYSVTRFN
jgi:hypothetical protein